MNRLKTLILILFLVSCGGKQNGDIRIQDLYNTAIHNHTSSPNYVVFIAVDEQENIKKEICTDFITLSVNTDSDVRNLERIEYNDEGIPVIRFKSQEALNNIGFYEYNTLIADSLVNNIDQSTIEAILIEHQKSGYSKLLERYTSEFSNHYFEHALYKKKILTYRDCETGYTVIEKIN